MKASTISPVLSIAAKTPAVVEVVLGKPDKIELVEPGETPCKEEPCEKATYQGGKYEVVFVNGLADWITISQVSAYTLDESVVEYLGLLKIAPAFSNPFLVIRWENIAGLKEVSAFNNGDDKVAYFYIKCITE